MFRVHCGHAKEVIVDLEQVHCVVTSPPYFKKRKYGVDDREIGNENDVIDYIDSLVDLFFGINLHPMGSIWVNLGDKRNNHNGLTMVPERFALAMTQNGFLLVDSVIWAKQVVNEDGETEGGCMTEPAPGRLNGNGYEAIYRFVRKSKECPKANQAWSDTCAVRIPRVNEADKKENRYLPKELMVTNSCIDGRNLGNVWRIQMGQTTKKHYAVYPKTLCERPIAMTCPMEVCPACHTPRERVVEMVEYDEGRGSKRVFGKYNSEADADTSGRMDTGKQYVARKPKVVGWSDCGCNKGFVPGVVLDPFCGTGTTGEVAIKLGRSFIGVDLYQEFADMTEARCQETVNWLTSQKLNPAAEAR